jgi:hypothetical protein
MPDHRSYGYTDDVSALSGVVYYRLKIVNMNGTYSYSPVKIIRTTTNNAGPAISVYPNPAVSELRITIPASWQNKPVNYFLYDTNGKIIKHFHNSHASQTESVQISDIKTGVYMILISNGIATASDQLVKLN